MEKSAVVGGTWRHQGNAFSRVNSSEPSYRILMSERAPMTNHSHHSEILREAYNRICRTIESEFRCQPRAMRVFCEDVTLVSNSMHRW